MHIRIDDEPFEVETPQMTMAQLLELAGVSTSNHFLHRVEADGSTLPYRALNFTVNIYDGDRFLTALSGPATAQ